MPLQFDSAPAACERPNLRADALADPAVAQTLDTLLQSILAGEDPTTGETLDQWRARIESLALRIGALAYES